MSWAQVCNSAMYRWTLYGAVALSWAVVGCQKPTTNEAPPPIEPAAKPVEKGAEEAAKAPEEKAAEEMASAKAEEPEPLVVQDVGFKTPESVYYDEKSDTYLVSNINGAPTEVDNNGFISKVSPDGTVTALAWIAGGQNDVTLNAPKGMTVKDDVLYVTDINTVRMFDMASGASKGDIPLKKATFLNDVALGPTGVIYVSDSGIPSDKKGAARTDAVWTIKNNKAKKLISGTELDRPNGLLADEGGVWVVTLAGTELYHVADDGKRDEPVAVPGGTLDGIVRMRDGNLLISSWQAKSVFKGQPGGPFTPVLADVASPADIGYDAKRNRLLVPMFEKDAIQIQALGGDATALRADAPEPEIAAAKAEPDEGAEGAEAATAKKAGEPAAAEPSASPAEATKTKTAETQPGEASMRKPTKAVPAKIAEPAPEK